MKRLLLAALLLAGCREKPLAMQEVRLEAVDGQRRDLTQAASVLRERLSHVKHAKVERAEDGLVVTVPALDHELRRLVTERGLLSFAPVVDRSATARALASDDEVRVTEEGAIEMLDRAALLEKIRTAAPLAAGEEVALEEVRGKWRAWIVDGSRAMQPRIERAAVKQDEMSGWAVTIEMDGASGERFAALTRALVGKQVAILYDGEVRLVPTVMEPITEGNAVILTRDETDARVLAATLSHEPLPVALRIVTY